MSNDINNQVQSLAKDDDTNTVTTKTPDPNGPGKFVGTLFQLFTNPEPQQTTQPAESNDSLHQVPPPSRPHL